MKLSAYGIAAVVLVSLLAGCGGGGGTAPSPSSPPSPTNPGASGTGRATFTVRWPEIPATEAASRAIPVAAQYVEIVLRAGATEVGRNVLARPAGSAPAPTSTTFNNLPAVTLEATATAYPDDPRTAEDGSGAAQAMSAIVPITVLDNQIVEVRLVLQSRIQSLRVTPETATIPGDGKLRLIATAFDQPEGQGAVVLIHPSKLMWASTDLSKASVLSSTTDTSAEVTGLLYTGDAGVAITVTETESELPNRRSAAATIKVERAISISPAAPTVNQGATQQFTALLPGFEDKRVTWEVDGGSITQTGLFTAPNANGKYRVRVQSVADPSKSAEATVTVPELGISLLPTVETIDQGARRVFRATVTGVADTRVTWSATKDGTDVSDRTLSRSENPDEIFFTPPVGAGAAGTYKVRVTSRLDTSKSAEATVTVRDIEITIAPKPARLTSLTQQFTATVTNTTQTGVTWKVGRILANGQFQEDTSGASGTITENGLYTAPSRPQEGFGVLVTSTAQTTKTDLAPVEFSVGNINATIN